MTHVGSATSAALWRSPCLPSTPSSQRKGGMFAGIPLSRSWVCFPRCVWSDGCEAPHVGYRTHMSRRSSSRLEPTSSHWASSWCRLLYCSRGVNSPATALLQHALRSSWVSSLSFPSSTSCWGTTHEVGGGSSTPTFRFRKSRPRLGVALVTGYSAVASGRVRHRPLARIGKDARRSWGVRVRLLGSSCPCLVPCACGLFAWTLPGIAFLAAAGTWRVRASALVLPAIIVLSVLQFRGVECLGRPTIRLDTGRSVCEQPGCEWSPRVCSADDYGRQPLRGLYPPLHPRRKCTTTARVPHSAASN